MKLRNLLALGLLLALTPLSAALAEGDDTTEPVTIGIDEDTPAEERTQARDVGNITVMGDRGIPVAWVIVEAQGQGTIRAEDVTVEATEWANAIGAQVNATASGAQATVEAREIAATVENGLATGAQIETTGGMAAVTAESVTAKTAGYATGVSATATDGGAATVQITGQGGVQAASYDFCCGVVLSAEGADAVIQAQVAGDIAAQSECGAEGASVGAFAGGETELACGGSVLADVAYGDCTTALNVSAMEGGAQATVTVAGDVVATGDEAIGLSVQAVDTGTAEVLVEGTISGETAVQVWGAGTEEAATLTVWALEGEIVGARGGDAEAFAQRIQYILKADPIEIGTVALDGATKYRGYDVATAGTTVTMLPNLAEGYTLVFVTNNDTPLAKDEDGHFFLVVPQGGGVYLTFYVESKHGDWPPIPVRCLGKVLSGDAALKFYDCGTFEIIQNGRGTVGFYAFEDDHLTLRCVAPVSLTENADGSATVTLGELSFLVEAAVIENLK